MTDEQINIAIAEACGWERHPQDRWIVIPPNSPHSVQPLSTIPDYCNDLNAMHEAEKVLTENQYRVFCDYLYDIACHAQENTKRWLWLSSTAKQRAEAFLRTVGKWEEASK